MTYKRKNIILILIIFVFILSGCVKEVESKPEDQIDWRIYQPNRTMVQYFTGGYENEGHMIVIDILNDSWMQQKTLSTGAATYAVYQFHDGYPLLLEGNEAGDFGTLDSFWDLDYTEGLTPESIDTTEASARFTPYKWETKDYDGQPLSNEAVLEKEAFNIGTETFDALKVTTRSETSEDYRIKYYVEGLGMVQYTWMMKGETGESFIGQEDRLVGYAYIDGLGGPNPKHKITVTSGLAEREGFEYALPMEFDRYTSDWLLVTNRGSSSKLTSPELVHMILDLNGNVLKQFKVEPPKQFSSIYYVGAPVPFLGKGTILECNTVDNNGEPIIELYWFMNRNWTLIDQFPPSPPMSQNNLPTVFVFTVTIIEDYVVYATGERDETTPENLMWKVYDRRIERTIQNFSVPDYYIAPSNAEELSGMEGFYRIAFDRNSVDAVYLNIETGELQGLQTP